MIATASMLHLRHSLYDIPEYNSVCSQDSAALFASIIMWAYIHPESKNQSTILLSTYSQTMNLFSKFLVVNLQWRDHQRPTTFQTCRYTTLWNISCQQSHRSKARQRLTKRARFEETVTAVDELILSQEDHIQNHRSTAYCRKDFYATFLCLKC